MLDKNAVQKLNSRTHNTVEKEDDISTRKTTFQQSFLCF